MKQKKSSIYSRFFFFLFLLSFPLSVSLSQASFILSFFFFLWAMKGEKKEEWKSIFPVLFWSAMGIYLSIFLVSFFNSEESIGSGNFWKNFSKGETSDFWMSFGIPLAIYHYRNSPKLPFYLTMTAIANLVVGLVSVFTPYRLAKWVQLGFTYPEGERLQHFAGGIMDVGTYLPLGLMMTHLTYGGLLGLLAPGVTLYAFLVWKKHGYPVFYGLVFFIFFLLECFLIFYNQSRSIWVGLVILVFLLGFQFLFRYIFQETITRSVVWKALVGVLILGSLFYYSGSKLYESNWLVRRAVQDVFLKKSTENQRYFILRNSFSILEENWFSGIGNNRFTQEFEKQSHEWIQENEWLWYELNITPRGHAHHDFLHFWISGGIVAGLLFVVFWAMLFAVFWEISHRIFHGREFTSKNWEKVFLGMGCLVIFPAGFFQCYMLDDEVALPFYSLVGIFWASFRSFTNGKVDPNSEKIVYINLSIYSLFKGLITVSLLLGFSVIYWKVRTIPPAEFVHERKKIWNRADERKDQRNEVRLNSKTGTPTEKNPSGKYWDMGNLYMEGCLTHRYGNSKYGLPIQTRDQAMGIRLEFPHYEKRIDRYPSHIKIQLLDRDSFDQDKLYRAHKSHQIAERWIDVPSEMKKNSNSTNSIPELEVIFPESILSEKSEDFPGKVRFRDFRLEFFKEVSGNPKENWYPEVRLKKLCD